MKLRLVTALFLFSLALSVQSQVKNICPLASVQGWSPSGVYASSGSYTSLNEAKDMISNIIAAVGLKQNFQVMAAGIPNAAAVVYHGQRYILYNPDFISRLNAAAGNKWAAVSVLAHEVGHHLNGHTLDGEGSQPARELEADEFSGFVLGRLGASLEEAGVAMKVAANYKSSLTHPAQQQRLVAIGRGWNNATRAALPDKEAKIYEPPVIKAPATATAARPDNRPLAVSNSAGHELLEDKYILKDVHFNEAQDAHYFITIRYHLVKIHHDQLFLVGNVVPIKNSDYPFVITGANDAKLFIQAGGYIVNASGRQVGYITAHE